ncbi:hypothetical protein CLAIMM_11794 isoform 1 [Cladophialophora immunda]|nr:hypothetical protein CLAIMM_11794 isoform 1 [Cladophialophora immunda]
MEHLEVDIEGGIASKVQASYLLKRGPDVPKDKEAFHKYPQLCGWETKDDGTLESRYGSSNPVRLGEMLQGWLYFGLIFTIVQKDGQPILKLRDLVTYNGQYLNSKSLRSALETWFAYEIQHPEKLRYRMIQVEHILEKARRVVQKNCSYDIVTDRVPYTHTKNNHLHYLQDECALVLMSIGETLSAVQRRILQEPGKEPGTTMFTSGWISDESPGWGPPRWVFAAMKRQGWCPKTIQLLQGQLLSCATLLVAAFSAYDGASRMIKGHEEAGCTPERCKALTPGGGTLFHQANCDLQERCVPVGPDMTEVVQIINSACIPLLEFQDETPGDESLRPKVTSFNPIRDKTRYFVVSHLWSDGWGNEVENKFRTCQLEFLKGQIFHAAGGKNVPFWMDTLLIPVDRASRRVRGKAISQIHQVFEHATATVVLDNGLLETSRGSPVQAAMKFLASSWMRRLWTLHEAWLSKRLLIPFKGDDLTGPPTDLNGMRDGLEQRNMTGTAIYRMMLDQFREHFGGQERLLRLLREGNRRYSSIESQRGAAEAVVADTSRSSDEVTALATLLDLNLARVQPLADNKYPDKTSQMSRLWSEFWMAFQEQYPGAIPAGMIFLPGPKVKKQPGFGWAPCSWISATQQVDYPDPMALWNGPTTLYSGQYQIWRGLGVTYPGFLLHMEDENTKDRFISSIVSARNAGQIKFPTSSALTEWYVVRPADDNTMLSNSRILARECSQLALILSRPRPRFVPEIGLLVGICRTTRRRTESEGLVYCCWIICRTWINRASIGNDDKQVSFENYMIKEGSGLIIGEELTSEQSWIVDRCAGTWEAGWNYDEEFCQGISERAVHLANNPITDLGSPEVLSKTIKSSSLDLEGIRRILDSVHPNGDTAIGTMLHERIIRPLVFSPLAAGNLKRPLLVSVLTDGGPTPEPVGTLANVIINCGDELERKGYPRDCVKFLIGQVGSSKEATEFLDTLRNNPAIASVTHVFAGRIDDKFKSFRDERSLVRWLVETLFMPLAAAAAQKWE